MFAVAAPERRPRLTAHVRHVPRDATDGRALLPFSSPQGVWGCERTRYSTYSGGTTRRMADGRTTLLTRQPTRSYVTLSFHTRWVSSSWFSVASMPLNLGRVHSAPPGLAAIQFACFVTFGLLCIPAPKSSHSPDPSGHSCWHAHVCLPRCIFSGSHLPPQSRSAAPLW